MTQIVVTITGPSSSGKTVLSSALVENGFEALVSTTTRPPRKGEIEGHDYYFVNKEVFTEMHEGGQLIEDVQFDGNFYGVTEKEAVRAFEKGKPAVLVAEPNGTQQIHDLCTERGWKVFRVFVNNPIDLLVERMIRRFHEDVKDLDINNPDEIGLIEKKIATHSKRLHKIVTQEQEEWVKPAYSKSVAYDLIVDRFDASNTEEIVQKVSKLVEDFKLQSNLEFSQEVSNNQNLQFSPRKPKLT